MAFQNGVLNGVLGHVLCESSFHRSQMVSQSHVIRTRKVSKCINTRAHIYIYIYIIMYNIPGTSYGAKKMLFHKKTMFLIQTAIFKWNCDFWLSSIFLWISRRSSFLGQWWLLLKRCYLHCAVGTFFAHIIPCPPDFFHFLQQLWNPFHHWSTGHHSWASRYKGGQLWSTWGMPKARSFHVKSGCSRKRLSNVKCLFFGAFGAEDAIQFDFVTPSWT